MPEITAQWNRFQNTQMAIPNIFSWLIPQKSSIKLILNWSIFKKKKKKIASSFKTRNLLNNLFTSVKSESDSMDMWMPAGTLEACRIISLWILPDDEVSFMPDRVKAIGGKKK